MATATNVPTFPEFELQSRDTAPTRFEKYVKRLNNMFTAMGITQAFRKKAILLHYVGEETCDVFETLTVPEPTGESDEYRTAVNALTDYFEPQKCVDHHRVLHSSSTAGSQMRVHKYRFGNKTANNSRNLISSPKTQIHRAKPQLGRPAESCSVSGDRRRANQRDRETNSHAIGLRNNKTSETERRIPMVHLRLATSQY